MQVFLAVKRCLIPAAVVGLVAGCALPTEQVESYRTAFSDAREAGTLLLDKIAPAVASVAADDTAQTDCGLNAARIYRCFDPSLALESRYRADPPSIQARRLALEAITLYNDVLLDIVDGGITNGVSRRLSDLTTVLTSLAAVVPGVSLGGLPQMVAAATPATQAFLDALGNPIAAGGLRHALVLGAPIIRELLNELEEDTSDMYQIYLNYRNREDVIGLERDILIARQTGQSTTALETELTAVVEDINTFHDSLSAYVRVLEQTATALDALVAAAENPVNSVEDLTRLIKGAGQIRASAVEFWNVVRRLH